MGFWREGFWRSNFWRSGFWEGMGAGGGPTSIPIARVYLSLRQGQTHLRMIR